MTLDVSPPAPIPHVNAVIIAAGLTPTMTRPSASADTLEQPDKGLAQARTLVHVFEAVRNEGDEVVDFRLNMRHADATAATRGFDGICMAQIGPSVAPGEALWMLKQVFASGEPARTETRHVSGEFELRCRQSAVRHGDTVVTTTTLWMQPVAALESRAA